MKPEELPGSKNHGRDILSRLNPHILSRHLSDRKLIWRLLIGQGEQEVDEGWLQRYCREAEERWKDRENKKRIEKQCSDTLLFLHPLSTPYLCFSLLTRKHKNLFFTETKQV